MDRSTLTHSKIICNSVSMALSMVKCKFAIEILSVARFNMHKPLALKKWAIRKNLGAALDNTEKCYKGIYEEESIKQS